MRVVIQQYGVSNSARELANYLGVKRLKLHGSHFIGKMADVIINWGSQKTIAGRARILNKPNAVYNASNKLSAFKLLDRAGVSIPKYKTDLTEAPNEDMWVARTKLSGHSGDGIVTGMVSELPLAPLYVEYIPKVREYRAIVVGDSIVDFKQKKKRSSERGEDGEVIEASRIIHDEHVWNLDGGYIFARDGINIPDGVDALSVSAISALGLDFGAVDIIEDREGTLYVLEVNTAFGLEGTTIEKVGTAMRGLL